VFTGIVEEIGVVRGIKKGVEAITLQIQASFTPQLEFGESVAVNGTCLTVEAKAGDDFQAQVMPQTFRHTNLSQLQLGSRVNLERALRLDSRLGGHIVQGHVDGVGRILSSFTESNAVVLWISLPEELEPYVLLHGSIAVDGTSLTISALEANRFAVSLIPHTRGQTILGEKRVGELVNLEADVLGKYVEKLLTKKENTGLTLEKLARFGFV
jgi:riboflavin synthase